MPQLNLTAQTKEERLIKAYLEANASETLAEKINNGVRVQKRCSIKRRWRAL